MKRPEEALHRAAVAYLRASLPKPWLVWHTPNGGGRSKAEAGILKAMGTLAGMPDLFVLGPNDPFHTFGEDDDGCYMDTWSRCLLVAIEFKAPPKRLKSGRLSKAKPVLSADQSARQADLGACGVPYLVIDDLAELHRALVALGVPLKGQVRA